MSDKPLTLDEKIALARAPISVGILATLGRNVYSGKSSGGCGGDGAKQPVLGRDDRVTGWMKSPTRSH